MEHYVLMFYKVYIDDDLELTKTYFTTMSNLAKLSRPRYQVGVYRTIGPLVSFLDEVPVSEEYQYVNVSVLMTSL